MALRLPSQALRGVHSRKALELEPAPTPAEKNHCWKQEEALLRGPPGAGRGGWLEVRENAVLGVREGVGCRPQRHTSRSD